MKGRPLVGTEPLTRAVQVGLSEKDYKDLLALSRKDEQGLSGYCRGILKEFITARKDRRLLVALDENAYGVFNRLVDGERNLGAGTVARLIERLITRYGQDQLQVILKSRESTKERKRYLKELVELYSDIRTAHRSESRRQKRLSSVSDSAR